MITLDTNVVIYLWDTSAPAKVSITLTILDGLRGRRGPLGLQVVGETQNVLRRKLRLSPREAALHAGDLISAFNLFVPTGPNAREALDLMSAGQMSYWDALLATAARDTGCTIMLSEDMQHGWRLGALQVVNPFIDTPLSRSVLNELRA